MHVRSNVPFASPFVPCVGQLFRIRRPLCAGCRAHIAVVIVSLFLMFVPSRAAHGLSWLKQAGRCQPPNVFYKTSFKNTAPCCPLAAGVCPGGGSCDTTSWRCKPPANSSVSVLPIECYPRATATLPCPSSSGAGQACPASGHCPPLPCSTNSDCTSSTGQCTSGGYCLSTDAITCAPAPTQRPNIILFISDDQAECTYGTAGECRAAQNGEPIPAPVTPNLDLLAANGTIFPIAHNVSQWCFPSLNSMITGRYQRNFANHNNSFQTDFTTIPRALRSLGTKYLQSPWSTAPVTDPYDSSTGTGNPFAAFANNLNVMGGYCTFQVGKGSFSASTVGFDAQGQSELATGRTTCSATPSGIPKCATGDQATSIQEQTGQHSIGDLFKFIDALAFQSPPGSGTYRIQPFFAWYAPHLPHKSVIGEPKPGSVTGEQNILVYLFGDPNAAAPLTYPNGGLYRLKDHPGFSQFFSEQSDSSPERGYYGNMWWVDDNIREIRKFLVTESGRSGLASLPNTTVIIYLSDNGWFLPRSKKHFSENGFRTRLIVFDPMVLPSVPGWQVDQPPTTSCLTDNDCVNVPGTKCRDWFCVSQNPPPTSLGLAHAVDLFPTVMDYALYGNTPPSNPVLCPASLTSDSSCQADSGCSGNAEVCVGAPVNHCACDGRDLRPYVNGGSRASTPEALRHAMCGHNVTHDPASPDMDRYIVARPSAVGRCVDLAGASCSCPQGHPGCRCGTNGVCLTGHCTGDCTSAHCPGTASISGTVLGGSLLPGPPCLTHDDCVGFFPSGAAYDCVAAGRKWCRNSLNNTCTTDADCDQYCAAGTPCRAVCEPHVLKAYVSGPVGRNSYPHAALIDLHLDLDEQGATSNGGIMDGTTTGTVARDMSDLTGINTTATYQGATCNTNADCQATQYCGCPGGATCPPTHISCVGIYAPLIRSLNCCIDEWWWPQPRPSSTAHSPSFCPTAPGTQPVCPYAGLSCLL